jgi:ABC-type multidrug transport system fused ATPase/permease subunit
MINSAIDDKIQRAICAAGGRTIFLIAHRLSQTAGLT